MPRNTLPPLDPSKSTSGIILDPQSLERVVPESKRSDGSVRKEIRIRPGFTPQEDLSRFKGSRQQQAEKIALPKGHIIGWAPPPETKLQAGSRVDANGIPLSKSALKNLKRREKREEKANSVANAPDNWDSDDAVTSKESPPLITTSKGERDDETAETKRDEGGDVNAVTSKLDNMGL